MPTTRLLRLIRSRPRLGRDVAWAAVWLAAAAAVEVVGRRLESDLTDACFVVGLLVLTVVTHSAHARQRIGWWHAGEERVIRLRTWAVRVWGRSGADLRGTDDVPAGLPPSRLALLAALALGLAAAVALLPWLPVGLRTVGVHGSYSLYVGLLAGLWAALVFDWLGFGFVTAGLIADARIRGMDNRGVARSGRSPSVRLTAAIPGLTILVALSPLPPLLPVAGLVGCFVAAAGVSTLPRMQTVHVIWRATARPPRRASIGHHVLAEVAVACSGALLLAVVALGASLMDAAAVADMPMTQFLGRCAAWSSFAGLSVSVWRLAAACAAARSANPARPPPRGVYLGVAAPDEAVAALRRDGWEVRLAPAKREWGDVVVPETSVRDLGDAASRAWLARRYEIVQRRFVRRGLRRMLRAAAQFEFQKGSGFWIAPHLWFVPSLARDDEEENSVERGTGAMEQVLGPDHAHAIPLSARHHFHQVLAALDVDLIFVEDGVRWSGVRRVLTVIYEVYDVHGGTRRVSDRDFAGLTGLRIILHDFDIENPFRSDRFPEPDYEDVARARILHVFKDRGGEHERSDAPAPHELVPLLA